MNDFEFEQFVTALAFSAEKHRFERRKDRKRSAYINHPIQVTEALWKIGGVKDNHILTAALLHDVLEDTDTKDSEIEAQFGQKVLGIVRGLTDDKSLPKEVRKRKQVETASTKSLEAKTIKLADKISNVMDIRINPPGWCKKRKMEYIEWAREVVDQIRNTNLALERQFDEEYALTLAAIEK